MGKSREHKIDVVSLLMISKQSGDSLDHRVRFWEVLRECIGPESPMVRLYNNTDAWRGQVIRGQGENRMR